MAKSKSAKKSNYSVTSISAGFIAITSLFISIWSAFETRQNNRLSVTPKLEIELEVIELKEANYTYEVYIHNKGIGPAMIKDIDIFNGKTQIKTISRKGITNNYDMGNSFQELSKDILIFEKYNEGTFVATGEKILALELFSKNKLQTSEISNLDYILTYESIYNDQYEDRYGPSY